jgi:hypothetical protein
LALFHNENYLNENSFKKDSGLPFENTTFKASIILLDDQLQLLSIYTSDTNTTIAKYWSDGFLESIELLDDSKNSNNAFISIDRFLKNRIYNISKRDYYDLRNDTIAYFKIKECFNYNDFKSTILSGFQPDSSEIIVSELETRFDEYRANLSQSLKFDDKNIIKGRFKKTIPLHVKIDLLLKEDIENLKDVIKPHEYEDEKGLFIKSESAYNEFSSSNN